MRLTWLRLILLMSAILLAFAVLALGAHQFDFGRGPEQRVALLLAAGRFEPAYQLLRNELKQQPNNRALWESLVSVRAAQMRAKQQDRTTEDEFNALLKQAPFKDLRGRYLIMSGRVDAGIAALRGPGPGGQFALARGDLQRLAGRHEDALDEYRRAVEHTRNPDNVRALLNALRRTGRHEALADFLVQPDIRRHADLYDQSKGLILAKEPLAAARPLLEAEWRGYQPLTIAVSVLLGLLWLLVLLQLGRAAEWERTDQFLVPVALLLGAMSASTTLWASVLTEHWIGFEQRPKSLVFNLLYAVLGIGLREELIKLLFFLPILPLASRHRPHRDFRILILAACVGLGFAIEENIAYFARSPGAVLARFLTANFFHMTLTGLAGLHFARGVRTQFRNSEDAEVLGMVVLLHGAYDFLLIDETVAAFSWLSYTVFIWIAQKFLRDVRDATGSLQKRWPVSYAFSAAIAASLGGAYLLATVRSDPLAAIVPVALGILGPALIIYMFFREFQEPIRR